MSVLITGITGLVGGAVARRMLVRDPSLRVYALLRARAAWPAVAARLGPCAARVVPMVGDVTLPGLGLTASDRAAIVRNVRTVVHCAADTKFSQPLTLARAVNTAGTYNTLEVAAAAAVDRFVYVSTAFVAGARTGLVPEQPLDAAYGFVNAYEQSKHEAEALVRAAGIPHIVLRPSTVVCDDERGCVTQLNAVHRALRLCHAGLAAMMPGAEDTLVDLVTTEYVSAAIALLGTARDVDGRTFNLCAGAGAIPLGELLDRARVIWQRDATWRRRDIARPALTDLATYHVFETAVEETGDVRLAAITRSLSHFAPQLALPKQFETAAADALAGAAPRVSSYWDNVVQELMCTRWGAIERGAA